MYGTDLMDETGKFFEPFACPGQGIEPIPPPKKIHGKLRLVYRIPLKS